LGHLELPEGPCAAAGGAVLNVDLAWEVAGSRGPIQLDLIGRVIGERTLDGHSQPSEAPAAHSGRWPKDVAVLHDRTARPVGGRIVRLGRLAHGRHVPLCRRFGSSVLGEGLFEFRELALEIGDALLEGIAVGRRPFGLSPDGKRYEEPHRNPNYYRRQLTHRPVLPSEEPPHSAHAVFEWPEPGPSAPMSWLC